MSPLDRSSVVGIFLQRDALGADHVARRARGQFRVARLVQQTGQPADLQLRAALDEHVGAIQLHDQARLGIHEMRVLGRLGQRREFDMVAADFPGDGRQVRRGGDDVQFGLTPAGIQRRRATQPSSSLMVRFHCLVQFM